jgi:hypothetical protein
LHKKKTESKGVIKNKKEIEVAKKKNDRGKEERGKEKDNKL